MEFARKQLEKYGWTDGKGLGKYENGISEPVKAKIKHSLTGVGYDPAIDFTEHWWSALYDKAASNLEVKNKNGKTKKIRRISNEEFEITNSTWKMKSKKSESSEKEEYSEFFVKTAVIAQGGDKITRVKDSDSESDSDSDPKGTVNMTDEELFAACQGRTAHKGARHGIRALGKLARIEQQEQILLQQNKYKGYSHHERIKKNTETDSKVVEDTILHSDGEVNTIKKKKKKKKRCNSTEKVAIDSVAINENEVSVYKKSAKLKNKITELYTQIEDSDVKKIVKSKKKKMETQY